MKILMLIALIGILTGCADGQYYWDPSAYRPPQSLNYQQYMPSYQPAQRRTANCQTYYYGGGQSQVTCY